MKELQAKLYGLTTRARHFRAFNRPGKQDGATAIEYALIAAMVAIALVAFVPGINEAITGIFTQIENALTDN